MGLNYPIEISRLSQEDGGGYYACIPQLGRYAFQGDGATLEEALKELEVSKRLMFEEIDDPENHDLYVPKKGPRKLGTAEGQIWIADDFDAPLDDFKEYIE